VQGKCFDEVKASELDKAIAQMTELLTQDDLTMDKKHRHVMKKNGKDECGLPFFL
jgi:flagellar biosynthesis chaperone FliJ